MPNNTWKDFMDDCVNIKNGETGIMKWFRPWEPYHNGFIDNICEHNGLYTAILKFYFSEKYNKKSSVSPNMPHSHKLVVLRQNNLEGDFNNFIKTYLNINLKLDLKRENVSTPVTNFKKSFTEEDKELIVSKDYSYYNSILKNYNEGNNDKS